MNKKNESVDEDVLMCDVDGCENRATVNYQDAFIKWTIDSSGAYCEKKDMDIISAGDETNAHLCDTHDSSEYYA